MARRKWTDDDIRQLKEMYAFSKTKDVAIALKRTVRATIHKAAELGLSRPEPGVGDRFGWLTVVKTEMRRCATQNKTYALARCDCGRDGWFVLSAVVGGNTMSCGCRSPGQAGLPYSTERTKHGLSKSSVSTAWYNMVDRCNNPQNRMWHRYGGRGIGVCAGWSTFRPFALSSLGRNYRKGLQIDRIDNDGGYWCGECDECRGRDRPANCRLADRKAQANNRSDNIRLTYNGEKKTIQQWSEDERCRVSYQVLYDRVQRLGWGIGKAMGMPTREFSDWQSNRLDGNTTWNGRLLTAFGETKTASEWVKDRRCQVGYRTLMSRLNSYGYSHQEAVATPVKKRYKRSV